MNFTHSLAYRRLATSFGSCISRRTFIMSHLARCQQQMEEIKNNPYYSKYAEKIEGLQKSAPNEFLDRIDKMSRKVQSSKSRMEAERNYSELLHPKEALAGIPQVQDKRLSDVMKMDLIKNKTAEEIKQIWCDYHMNKDVVAAVIPSATYKEFMEKGNKYPVFIFPLPRSTGYEFIMLQFAGNTVHFTPLLCYQVHKENAPECLSLVYYTEMQDKGIVLMRGEFDANVLNATEARCLANQLQLYYYHAEESKEKLLETFTHNPNAFKHTDLVKELENIKLQ